MDEATLNNVILASVTAFGAVFTAFAVAFVIWTYNDMRSRSRDPLAPIAAALMVGLLNLFGLIIYVMLRPRETLADAYERSLEEEALLQEIEEKPTCPGCGRSAKQHWQLCPYCHTKLKKPCYHCNELLELSWQLCPACGTPQLEQQEDGLVRATNAKTPQQIKRRSSPSQVGMGASPYDVGDARPTTPQTDLEWVEGEY